MTTDDKMNARLINTARRYFGRVRCPGCGRTLKVPEDDVLAAREELRAAGWVETVPWDGDDGTSLTNWHCGCLDEAGE